MKKLFKIEFSDKANRNLFGTYALFFYVVAEGYDEALKKATVYLEENGAKQPVIDRDGSMINIVDNEITGILMVSTLVLL